MRDDLRLRGHAAVTAAAQRGKVLPVFVLEDAPRRRAPGAAACWWQRLSLASLARDIGALGGRLLVRRGTPETVLAELAADTHAAGICCQRSYDAGGRDDESAVRRALRGPTRLETCDGDMLVDPASVLTAAGGPYRVFTPFWRALRKRVGAADGSPATQAQRIEWFTHFGHGEEIDRISVPDERFGWTQSLARHWTPGEDAARHALAAFHSDGIATYEDDRNTPGMQGTSRLSPHLRFGEIGIREAWDTIAGLRTDSAIAPNQCEAWLRELGWREFCRYLVFHFPDLPTANFRSEFDRFQWQDDADGLTAWQHGNTGYPLVDAGMRELWHTGWMHNRVRMVVASFLTKHLRVHWRAGEAWFWDTLIDADYASNPANWQWTAGTGADAAPYFRIFNPSTQAQKFDAQGHYIRRWVPEIAELSGSALHQPWLARESELRAAGIVLGETYPLPIVDHSNARAAALAAHAELRSKSR